MFWINKFCHSFDSFFPFFTVWIRIQIRKNDSDPESGWILIQFKSGYETLSGLAQFLKYFFYLPADLWNLFQEVCPGHHPLQQQLFHPDRQYIALCIFLIIQKAIPKAPYFLPTRKRQTEKITQTFSVCFIKVLHTWGSQCILLYH